MKNSNSTHLFSILMPLVCLTSYVQRAYFVRSTCLLRTFNVFTSYEVRQTHQVFLENSSEFLENTSDLLANSSDFFTKEMPQKGKLMRGKTCFVY